MESTDLNLMDMVISERNPPVLNEDAMNQIILHVDPMLAT